MSLPCKCSKSAEVSEVAYYSGSTFSYESSLFDKHELSK